MIQSMCSVAICLCRRVGTADSEVKQCQETGLTIFNGPTVYPRTFELPVQETFVARNLHLHFLANAGKAVCHAQRVTHGHVREVGHVEIRLTTRISSPTRSHSSDISSSLASRRVLLVLFMHVLVDI